MRVLFLPNGSLPWMVGGKEVYSHNTAKGLRAQGVDVRTVIHQTPFCSEPLGEQEHEGVPITVLPPVEGQEERRAVYSCLPDGIPGFRRLMEGFDPHIVHLHDFSSGANLLHLRAAKTHGAKIVMTYHSPGQSCLQRSLLYQGRTPCDGEILEIRCTECRLTNAGMPSLAAKALAAVPISDRFDAFSLPGVSRALTSRQNTRRFIEAWRELIETLDKAIVYSDWSRDLMLLNGVPASMLRMVRTGMEGQRLPQELPTEPRGLPLRVAYVGRCDLAKGIDILIDAVKKMERTDIEVHFFGPYWEEAYGLSLLRRIDGDPRFNTPKMVAPDQVMQILRGMDVCVVPSRMLETGPIVVLEAFAAGKPVIGSRLGGIAELVTDGVDGLLFPPGDADSLSGLLTRLVQDPGLLEALEAGVMAPRTFTDVALEMGEVYRELLT